MSYISSKENYDHKDDICLILDIKCEEVEITNELVKEVNNSEISELAMNFFLLYGNNI